MSEDAVISAASDKVDMRIIEQIRKLRKECPADADALMKLTMRGVVHTHRLRWAYYCLQAGRTLLGFGGLIVMGFVATQFIEAGAIIPASVSIGIGAGTVVATFVTGRTPPSIGAAGKREEQQRP